MIASERLRQARVAAGFASASAAADAFGWTKATYLGHENGSRGIRPSAAQKYSRAFGVTSAWLLFGQTEKTIRTASESAQAPELATASEPMVPVSDRRLAEMLAVLVDAWEAAEEFGRGHLKGRFDQTFAAEREPPTRRVVAWLGWRVVEGRR